MKRLPRGITKTAKGWRITIKRHGARWQKRFQPATGGRKLFAQNGVYDVFRLRPGAMQCELACIDRFARADYETALTTWRKKGSDR